jgi:hypothetical protein
MKTVGDLQTSRHRAEMVKAREEQLRLDREIAECWGVLDKAAVQRTAMISAAIVLELANEPRLAHWLLYARPGAARVVASGVAVHALRRGVPAVWDILLKCDAKDSAQSEDDYLAEICFVWEPGPDDIVR